MNPTAKIVRRIERMLRDHNVEIWFDVVVKSAVGLLFICITFGLLFWIAWFFGFFMAGYLGLASWQFAGIVTALFFVVATWSAWRRVDPLANLEPMTVDQQLATMLSMATPGVVVFSPRHTTAGIAIVLIGGPANVIEAFGIWAHRIRVKKQDIEEAARLIESCVPEIPVRSLKDPIPALLLLRLKLIKIMPGADEASAKIQLTQKGSQIQSAAKTKKRNSPSV